MSTRSTERRLHDIRDLTEALARALEDAQARDPRITREAVAEQLGVRRAYLSDAISPYRGELQFQARHLIPYCRIVGVLPLAYVADQLGYVLVPREQATQARDIAMETLDVAAEAGQLSALAREAYADGHLSEQERNDLREQARRVQREAAEVERAVTTSPVRIVREA